MFPSSLLIVPLPVPDTGTESVAQLLVEQRDKAAAGGADAARPTASRAPTTTIAASREPAEPSFFNLHSDRGRMPRG
jgi:hypothetical protein